MSISVSDKLRNRSSFPLEVFPEKIRGSIEQNAEKLSVPVDLVAGAALFNVAGLAGNLYKANVNGGVKPTLYLMLVAPSGVGKTPANNVMGGNIIAPLRAFVDDRYKRELLSWKERRRVAMKANAEFTESQPVKKVRMVEDATLEAIMKNAETSPAGFGVFYDEGERLFSGVNQFKKDTSSTAFWNENFNGKTFESLRVDSDRDRFIKNLAISLMIGMQTSRLSKYFTEDVLASGLAYRFLICVADYRCVNDNIDFFGEDNKGMCEEWKDLIRGLFHKGVDMCEDQAPIMVEFTLQAKIMYNTVMGEIASKHNDLIRSLKKEDENTHIIAAGAKLQAYVARLALVLAIIEVYTAPAITPQHVENAYKLYKFFKRNSDKILLKLNSAAASGLTESELELLEALPDQEFTAKQAEQICDSLKLNPQFFKISYSRKFRNKYVKSVKRGVYEKL